ncbi:shikimate dehydrogenase [Ferroplasma sp.]|uniref:shikimate dehydrogenase family protein n=1 Tax=Ferroplasma sp. TaxID=2591003 RepID=UPI00307E1394
MIFSALIGDPVRHSIGQDIYNKLFRKYNINSQYLAIELHKENLPGFFGLARNKIDGFNITAPYKEESIKYLDHIDEIVSNTNSVNLVKNNNGELYGYNSDYNGFLLLSKKNNIDYSGKNVIIMGSGGAARTVAFAIMKNYNADISIVSRDPGKISIAGIKTIGYSQIGKYDIIINCTPLGTFPDTRIPISSDRILENTAGIDIIYNPPKTPFLKVIENKGGLAVNGSDMFIGQGMETLKRIYDIVVDYSEFRELFIKNINRW